MQPDADPVLRETRGYVYLIGCGGVYYKIGKARDPQTRLRSLNTGPLPMFLVHQIATNDPRWLEEKMHQEYATQCVRNEWFTLLDLQVEKLKAVSRMDNPAVLRPTKAGVGPLRIGEVMRRQLEALAEHNNTTLAHEATVAIGRYLQAAGLWPPPQTEQE